MDAAATDEANSVDNGDAGGGCQGALQLLWCERELQADSEILEVSSIHRISHAESATPETEHEVSEVPENLGLLHSEAAAEGGHLGLATEDCLKSRVRKNRTHGSVRGSDIPSQVVNT